MSPLGDKVASGSQEQEAEPKQEEPKEAPKATPSPYTKEITLKADKIMREGNPAKFIMDTFNTFHVGDRDTGKILLVSIGTQSVKNTQGVQPKMFGGSGKGKTHAAKSMLHLVSEQHKIEGSLSDKALYYMKMHAGTIVFSDDIDFSDELEGIIKRATTNFQSETIHRTVSVQREIEQHRIPPRIIWILTSVDDNFSPETLNRFVETGVDESPEQDEKVFNQQIEKDLTGSIEFPVTDDVLVCRLIFDAIKHKLFIVKIPFIKKIRWDDKVNRRNFPIFTDYIKSFAVLRFKQRNIIIEGSETILEATMDDFNDARDLYTSRAENQKLKLTDTEIKLIRAMDVDWKYESADLQKILGVSQPRIHQILHGQKDKHGLLNKIPDIYWDRTNEEDEDDKKKRTYKNIYILKKSYVLDTYGSVVGISE